MAESKIPVTPGTGLDLDSTTVSTGQGTVHREAVHQADPDDAAARAKVTNADPAANAYGGVVRIAGSVPLPSGAATGAKQDVGNASLASIDSKLPGSGLASEATLAALRSILDGNLAGPEAWQVVPHLAAADLITGDVQVRGLHFVNTSGGALTITLKDRDTPTPLTVLNGFSLPAGAVLDLDWAGSKFKGGINWQASAAGVVGSVVAYQ